MLNFGCWIGEEDASTRLVVTREDEDVHRHDPRSLLLRLGSCSLASPDGSPFRLDICVEADDDGQAVDFDFGGLVAVGAGDSERLAGG